jgi:hypothetical protein
LSSWVTFQINGIRHGRYQAPALKKFFLMPEIQALRQRQEDCKSEAIWATLMKPFPQNNKNKK